MQQEFDPRNHRACGAMSLAKVYREFGKEVAGAEIWPKVSRQNRFGSVASVDLRRDRFEGMAILSQINPGGSARHSARMNE